MFVTPLFSERTEYLRAHTAKSSKKWEFLTFTQYISTIFKLLNQFQTVLNSPSVIEVTIITIR